MQNNVGRSGCVREDEAWTILRYADDVDGPRHIGVSLGGIVERRPERPTTKRALDPAELPELLPTMGVELDAESSARLVAVVARLQREAPAD